MIYLYDFLKTFLPVWKIKVVFFREKFKILLILAKKENIFALIMILYDKN